MRTRVAVRRNVRVHGVRFAVIALCAAMVTTAIACSGPPGSRAAGVRVGVIDLRDESTLIADIDVDIVSGPTEAGASMEVEIVNGSIAIGDWDSCQRNTARSVLDQG